MGNDIKSLLDAIIDGNDKTDLETGNIPNKLKPVDNTMKPTSFSTTDFREKISLCVLRDIISAMMHDDVKDLTGMIDDSIMRHIRDDYHDTCFGYLCKSRDRLNSPVLGDIITEIDDVAYKNEKEVDKTGLADNDPDAITKEILNHVDNYDELRERLRKAVSDKVVKDVTGVVTASNDAPVFDKIDEKIKPDTQSNLEDNSGELEMNPNSPEEQAASESVILNMCGKIVTEYAIAGQRISTDEGIERAIITYCLGEMDALFKSDPSRAIVRKYS